MAGDGIGRIVVRLVADYEEPALLALREDPILRAARSNLKAWVGKEYWRTSEELGFGYRVTREPSESIEELCNAFAASHTTGRPLRLGRPHDGETVFPRRWEYEQYLFLYNVRRAELRAGFDTEGEMLVHSCHLARLSHAGYPNGTIEHRMLFAATAGETVFENMTGDTVTDPWRFALRCLITDLQTAIREEHALQLAQPSRANERE